MKPAILPNVLLEWVQLSQHHGCQPAKWEPVDEILEAAITDAQNLQFTLNSLPSLLYTKSDQGQNWITWLD